MTHRSCTVLVAIVAAAVAAPARAADPSWTTPQDLGATNGEASVNTALASNDRGDAVVVVSSPAGILVARASAGQAFSAPQRIASEGFDPSVAIDARGVALVAFSYDDGTHEATDLRDDDCCTGVKVSVLLPGHRATRPRAALRRGITTVLGAIGATAGHRGVLITNRVDGDPGDDVRLVPVRADGRLGRTRKVVGGDWSPMTLQWVAGRAIAGLVRVGDGHGTQLAVARQRRSLRFGVPRGFVRLSGQLSLGYYATSLAALTMSPDGRGGQIAAYQRGKRPNLRLALTRKPLDGRARTAFVQRGPSRAMKVSEPARSRDGWIAVVWARRGGAPAFRESAYLTTRSPGGRLATTALPSPVSVFDSIAVGVAPGGAGAVGAGGDAGMPGTLATITALGGGRPAPAVAVGFGPVRLATTWIEISANARDPARAVVELGGRALATRLQPAG